MAGWMDAKTNLIKLNILIRNRNISTVFMTIHRNETKTQV